MMTVKNPLELIPLNEFSDWKSWSWVVSCIISWWEDKTVTVWGGRSLEKLAPYYWFELHTQDMPRLCKPTTLAMETVVELSNEDCLTHPHTPTCFICPV